MAAPQPETDKRVVDVALRQIKDGEDEHTTRQRRYDDSYDVYRASKPNARGVKPWQSKLRVKYGMQVIDTALVNMVSGVPRAKVRPRRPDFELQARAMQSLLDYYRDQDHLVEKRPLFVQQGLIYGITVAKNHWLYNTRRMTVRRQDSVDPYSGQPSFVEKNEMVVTDDRPTFEPWDIYDVWWDPDARDVDSARYVVLRSWVTPDDLRANAYNPDAKTGIYQNVDALLSEESSRRPDTTAQSRALGLDRKGRIELLEVWRDDRLTVIGGRNVLLRDIPNPYWHGKKPVVIAQTRPDGFKMQGIPETELVDHLQQALWTVQNMRMDNLHMTVMRGITYREGGVYDPNALELRPLFKWAVQDHDDVRPFEVQPLPPEAYEEESALLGRMQLVTGINPYVSGSDMQAADQNTATGVTALQDVASRLLRFKAQQIHFKGYQRTYEQWAAMTKQFLTEPVDMRIELPGDTYTWAKLGPQDVVGDYDIVLEGSEESLSRQQERSEALALLNAFAPFAQYGIVNFRPILEKIATAYNFDSPDQLLQPQQQPQLPPPAPYPSHPGGGFSPNAGGVLAQQQPMPPGASQLPGGQPFNPLVGNAINGGR